MKMVAENTDTDNIGQTGGGIPGTAFRHFFPHLMMQARKRSRAQDRTEFSLHPSFKRALGFLCDLYSCDRTPFLEELIRESMHEIPVRLHGCATEMAHAFFVDALRKKSKAGDGPLSISKLCHGHYNKHLQQPLMAREMIKEKLRHPQRTNRVDFRSYFPRSKKARNEVTVTASNDTFVPDRPQITVPVEIQEFVKAQVEPISLSEIINMAESFPSMMAGMVNDGMEQMRHRCLELSQELATFEREDTSAISIISKASKKGVQPETIAFALKAREWKKGLSEQNEAEKKPRSTKAKARRRKAPKRSK